jgi:hypothetical protein
MKNIHNKKTFRADLTYARKVIRQIETALNDNHWLDVSDAANELSGTFASMTALAEDNSKGIENFACHIQYEVSEKIFEREL